MGMMDQEANLSEEIVASHETFFDFPRLY
jgi:hypothetical protein